VTKHKRNWQLSEDGAAICLECTTIIGADGLIESLQTENTKLQEEIAALHGLVFHKREFRKSLAPFQNFERLSDLDPLI